MAQVTFKNLGILSPLNPGDTKHHWWNNAGEQLVWAISADAFVATDVPVAPNSVAKVEVTRIESQQKRSGGTVEREIHYWVKNTGLVKAYYTVHMAIISD